MKKDFKFEQDGYTVQPEKNKVTKTRHGVRCVCPIFRDGKQVAVLDDLPERIVAPVEVADEAERKRLLQKARAAVKAGKVEVFGNDPTESTLLSEYLRSMSMAADAAWVKS